ncbi:MAG: CheR family methyltransferase [Pseudomonadota bacterium]
MNKADIEEIEVDLVLHALRERYGYDFRQYARASLLRRLRALASASGKSHIAELIPTVLHQPSFLDRVINGISVSVTEPFRDPQTLQAIVQLAFPWLKSHPFLKIWVAGCATGEEVYSLAILLEEAGLLDRTQIYATDINTEAIGKAAAGVFPLEAMQRAEENYRRAGGVRQFSDYYVAQYRRAKMAGRLFERVLLSQHNLATDSSFGTMQIILCRNVLIYFNRELQERAVGLFADSLTHRGFLAIGNKETLSTLPSGARFEEVDRASRLYRLH